MTHLLFRRWTAVLIILMPLLVLSACGAGANDSSLDSQVTDVAPADSQDSEELIVEVDFGPGTFNFPNTKAGLAELSSYKATLIMSFDGTHDGQAEQWSKTYIMLSTREPAARQLTIEKSGDLSELDALYMAEADGAAYERSGEETCNARVIDPVNSLAVLWEPAGFLTGVIGADEAGAETVNDVAANHYTFDERAFGQLDIAQSTGEMWVASEGGYIVKYLVTTQGDADYFGEGIEGTLTWDYELTEVNGPVAIDLPADCPPGMLDVPMLPNASNVLNMPGIVAYDVASTLAEASAFYEEQLPALGWQLQGEPTVTETTVLLAFSQGAGELNVIIFLGDEADLSVVVSSSSGAGELQAETEEGAGGLEAYLLPDATNVENTGGILKFNTSLPPEEAAAFYEEQMPALGWVSMGLPGIGGTSDILLFTKGAQVLSVIITVEDGVTIITVSIA